MIAYVTRACSVLNIILKHMILYTKIVRPFETLSLAIPQRPVPCASVLKLKAQTKTINNELSGGTNLDYII